MRWLFGKPYTRDSTSSSKSSECRTKVLHQVFPPTWRKSMIDRTSQESPESSRCFVFLNSWRQSETWQKCFEWNMLSARCDPARKSELQTRKLCQRSCAMETSSIKHWWRSKSLRSSSSWLSSESSKSSCQNRKVPNQKLSKCRRRASWTDKSCCVLSCLRLSWYCWMCGEFVNTLSQTLNYIVWLKLNTLLWIFYLIVTPSSMHWSLKAVLQFEHENEGQRCRFLFDWVRSLNNSRFFTLKLTDDDHVGRNDADNR
jgi:hypothetical protein